MSQTKEMSFDFTKHFQEENSEHELTTFNKEQEIQDVHLQKSYSVDVSYLKQFVPVLKPKKPFYHSANVTEFSLDTDSDCENFDEEVPQIQKSKSYDKCTNDTITVSSILKQKCKNMKCSQLVFKHLSKKNVAIVENTSDDCKDTDSSDDDSY